MLTVSTVGQSASSAAVNGPAFLIPALHADGLSLAQAGLLAAAPIAGSTVTLLGWGAIVDAVGERLVLLASLLGTCLALGGAIALVEEPVGLAVLLFLAGAAAAGTSSASGRVVVGWFPARRRGIAMGIRQMSQPIGVGIAAASVPILAATVGTGTALLALAVLAGASGLLCAATVIDPPRPARTDPGVATNPYRSSSYLQRIHAVSMLLVIPQFTVWTFMLVWLQVGEGWSPGAAGAAVAGAQALGALGRIGAGHLSDLVGSRTRPLQWVAWAAGGTMVAVGVAIGQGWQVAVPLMMLASMVTVADNGLAFTAVAERAGPYWGGRALGLQNTGQYLTAAAVPPVVGQVIPALGYGWAFGLTGLFPLVAALLVPISEETEAGVTPAPEVAA